MNEELDFLKEIKPLIDTYVRDNNQELNDLGIEGRRAIIEEIKLRREQRLQNLKQEIYDKTKTFIEKAKENAVEEKKELIKNKEKQLDEARDNLRSKYVYSKNTVKIRNMAKTISDIAYKSTDNMLQIAVNELRQANETYKKVQEEYVKAQKLETVEFLDEKYRNINFESEKGIEDIIRIVNSRIEELEQEYNNSIRNNDRTYEEDNIKVVSIGEIERRRQGEVKKNEEEQENSILNNDENTQEEEQDNTVLDNEENAVDEEKRKLEEEQMWEEYSKEQEEQEEQAKKETGEKLEEHEQKLAKAREKHDKSEAKFYENLEKEKQEFNEEEEKRLEKEKQIREKKEEFFNKKEEGYEDLLKDDLSYQALKERLINTYTLPQLGKAIGKKSLVEIYELYVKQVIKDLENTEIIGEGLSEEEMNEKLEEKLANEELKTTLSVRLEMLKERQKEIKERQEQERKAREQYNKREEQATKFFENIEKKYGIDILPTVYLKDKTNLIDKYAKGENTELLSNFKFLEYCEEQLKSLEEFINDPIIKAGIEAGGTLEEIDEYNDLQDKIKYIRAKALELGEIPPHIQEIKEKLENLFAKGEEGYKDLLPSLYDNFKERYINKAMLSYMNDSAKMDEFLAEYQEKYNRVDVNLVLESCEAVEMCITNKGNYTKGNGEVATAEEIYELRNAIQQIEKRKYIKENAYKETKIVVEPYNDRIMVYLKGEVKPRPYDHLAQLIADGEDLAKSDNIKTGLIRGVQKGDLAVLHVLQELEISTGQKLVDGYTWMYAKPNNIEKDKHPSPIDEIVYDFSKKDGKIQNKEMIKTMQKYAKTAENNGVAKSIGRKKGIIEKGTNGLKSFFGKGTEKVLALGEGIKNFHPIGNVIENRRPKKYSKDREIDMSKSSSTYNEWRADMDAKEEAWREKMGEDAPTLEEQADFMKGFNDRSEQETESERDYDKRQDEFYDMYGG